MKSLGRFVAGLVLGAIVAAALSFGLDGSASDQSATTQAPVETQTVIEVEPWFENGEVRFGPTVILPRGLRIDGGTAIFDYELAGLGPSRQARDDSETQGSVVVVPEQWLLTTVSGAQVEATTTSTQTASVRFDLPDQDAEIDTISVVGWQVGAVFGDTVELPVQKAASAVYRGGTVTMETVLEQRVSTIVRLVTSGVDGDGRSAFFLPAEPGWRVSGGQLIWDGEDAPEMVTLENVVFDWTTVSSEVVVFDRASQL